MSIIMLMFSGIISAASPNGAHDKVYSKAIERTAAVKADILKSFPPKLFMFIFFLRQSNLCFKVVDAH